MQKELLNSRLENVLKILYQPVPYLPNISFLERGRNEERKRKALARIREKSPAERKIRGQIETIGKGYCTLCGHRVLIVDSTWVFGDIRSGVIAEMTLMTDGEKFTAKRIVIM